MLEPSLDQQKFIPSSWNPKRLNQMRKIGIQDFTTDSEELVGLVVPRGHRTKIANLLFEIGVSTLALRAGHGSDDIIPSEENLRESSEIARANPKKTFAVCGPTQSDINLALLIGSSSVVIQTTTSQIGMEYRLKTDLQSLISKIVRAIDYAKAHGLSVTYMASDSTRAQKKDLRRIVREVTETHCEGIILSDSNGCASPFGIFDHVRTVSGWTRVPISAHCHNDYGLACANALSAIAAGAKHVQTCVAGIGERSGLASFEEVVLSIEHMLGTKTGIEISRLVSVCHEIADLLNYPILPKKPVIGHASICFEGERLVDSLNGCTAKESRLAMMPYLPEIVGGQEYVFLGSESGREALNWRLKHLYPKAVNLDDTAREELIANIKDVARAQRASVGDERLRQMYSSLANAKAGSQLTPPYMLTNIESKPIQMFAGVVRRTLAQSNNLMVVEFRFMRGAEVALHHHTNEQIGYVATGEVEMTIGDKNHHLMGGDSYLIAGEIIHGTKAITDSILVDIFYPPRTDYVMALPAEAGQNVSKK